MEEKFKSVLDYIDEIINHGDQGQVFDWIQEILEEYPDFANRLRKLSEHESDSDRKEVIDTILEDFQNS